MGYILRRHPVWWANYNYLLAMALACGVAFQGLVMAFAFNMPRVDFPYVESFLFLLFVDCPDHERKREREREVSPTLLTTPICVIEIGGAIIRIIQIVAFHRRTNCRLRCRCKWRGSE